MEKLHEKWKSKSCLATVPEKTKTALTSPSVPKTTPSTTPSLSPNKNNKTPQFDKDDILMNDDSVDAMPGLGLPPSSNTELVQTENTSIINPKPPSKAENVDVNMNGSNDDIESEEVKSNRKRKA